MRSGGISQTKVRHAQEGGKPVFLKAIPLNARLRGHDERNTPSLEVLLPILATEDTENTEREDKTLCALCVLWALCGYKRNSQRSVTEFLP